MIDQSAEKVFAGSIPKIYDRCLVPLIFVDYADDLAQRLAGRRLASVLRVAQVERAHHADVGAITLPAGNP